jgi:uncharacterized protein (TIGR02246 family)
VAAKSATTDRAAVIAVTERWAAAYGNGDLKSIAEMYTEDAKLMPEGSEAISGRSAIRQWFEKNLRPALPATIKFSNYEIYAAGQSATSVSEVEIRDGRGQLKTRGKQILVLLKRYGQWQIHRDIWTNNGPAKD